MADQAVVSSSKFDGGKVLSVIIYILLIIIAVELIFHLIIAPKLVIKNVMVETALDIDKARVLNLAGLSGDDSFFSVKPGVLKANLETYPMVSRAEVVKIFPDTLKIILIPRKPVAVAFVNQNEEMVPLVFDKEGVAFRVMDDAEGSHLPILSGIRFENFSIGDRLPRQIVSVMSGLKKLRMEKPVLYQTISEVFIARGVGSEFDITIYPIHEQVKLILGPRLTPELLHSAIKLAAVLKQNGVLKPGGEIDFRFGDVIYRKKEG